MTRPPRLVAPDVPMHLVQRGNDRTRIFRDEVAFKYFVECLTAASATHGCAVHAYVLMSNHVHLLLTPRAVRGPAHMMQQLGRTFGRWLNGRAHRTGGLWEGRFRSSLVESPRYFYACSRYIELNPVRAGLVGAPDAYAWSSYRTNALGLEDPLVTRHALYDRLGRDPAERAVAYRNLFVDVIPPAELDRLRRALRMGTRRDIGDIDQTAAPAA